MRKPKQILFLLLIITPVSIWAQSTSQDFSVRGNQLWVSMAVVNPPGNRIIESMRQGLESEVRYNVRVYERSSGFFSFLGDKLVGEWHSVHRARWDEFNGEFLVTNVAGKAEHMRTSPLFLSALFHLKDIDTGISLQAGHRYYVLSNAQVQIVKLVPPLTMIALFVPHHQIETPWVETEISAK